MSWHRWLIPLKAQQPLRELRPRVAFPVGMLAPFASETPPALWLECFGQSLDTTVYAEAFAVTAYTFGGSGANFSMPDLRGRVIAGEDDMGGSSANRLIGGVSGLNGDTFGAGGGVEQHALAISELAAHTHTQGTSGGTVNDGGGGNTVPLSGSAATGSTGSGGAHTNVQPTFILTWIMFVNV